MLRFLDNVRNGTVDPMSLRYAECTKRSHSLELSKYRDLEQVHSGGVNSLDIELIEGRYMLSGGSDGVIVVHDLDNLTGKPEYTCKVVNQIDRNYSRRHKFSVETVQWYPLDTGMFTSSGLDGLLKLWDTNTFKRVGEFRLAERIYQHHMSPNATVHYLIAVARTTSQVTLVDLKSGSFTHELRGHTGTVMTVRWSARHEHVLASGSCDNSLLLWDVRSPKSVLHRFDQHNKTNNSNKSTAHSGRVNGLCFSSDGHYLLSYGTDSRLHLWNMYSGCKETVNFGKIENESRKAIKFDISQNSIPDVVYVPRQGRVCAYELQNGLEVSKLIGHYNIVNCCVFHPFHQELYSGGSDHTILMWTPNHEQTDAYGEATRYKGETKKTTIFTRNNLTADNWSDED